VYLVTKLNGNKRVNLTPAELAINVKKLIQHAFSVPEIRNEDEDDTPLLVREKDKDVF